MIVGSVASLAGLGTVSGFNLWSLRVAVGGAHLSLLAHRQPNARWVREVRDGSPYATSS
jgi:hypothetical protein